MPLTPGSVSGPPQLLVISSRFPGAFPPTPPPPHPHTPASLFESPAHMSEDIGALCADVSRVLVPSMPLPLGPCSRLNALSFHRSSISGWCSALEPAGNPMGFCAVSTSIDTLLPCTLQLSCSSYYSSLCDPLHPEWCWTSRPINGVCGGVLGPSESLT